MDTAEINRRLNTRERTGPKKVKTRKAAFTILERMEEQGGRAEVADIERWAAHLLTKESVRKLLGELRRLGLVRKAGPFKWALSDVPTVAQSRAAAADITLEEALAKMADLSAQLDAARRTEPQNRQAARAQREPRPRLVLDDLPVFKSAIAGDADAIACLRDDYGLTTQQIDRVLSRGVPRSWVVRDRRSR